MYGVDVGWYGGKAEVQLTETSPLVPRIDLLTGENAAEVIWGSWADVSAESSSLVVTNLHKTAHVRVVRSFINGDGSGRYTEPILDKTVHFDSEIGRFLTEADFLGNGEADIDPGLYELAANDKYLRELPAGITNVTYRIIMGDEQIEDVTDSENLQGSVAYYNFSRNFDATPLRAQAIADSPTIKRDYTVMSTQPTFKWHLDFGNTYTQFRVVITGDGFAYDSGRLNAPAKDVDGNYVWTAPICVGDKVDGEHGYGVYANGQTYNWAVYMYNSKFDTTENGGEGSYYLNVPENSVARGNLAAKVRYFGPAQAFATGTVRVQAFATPDFAGAPVAAGYVADNGTLAHTGTAAVTNATIIGLAQGTYYIRAFIDTNDNGVCDDWESMGYLCGRGRLQADAFIPAGVQYSTGVLGQTEPVEIYIEDADTNQNCIPDAYEWAVAEDKDNWQLDAGGTLATDPANTGITYSPALSDALEVQDNRGPVTSGMAGKILLSMANTMAKPRVAALALGFNTLEEAQAAASIVDESATVVKITGITVNGTVVTVDYTTDVATMAVSTAASAFYVVADNLLQLPLVVKTKANLADKWTETVTEVSIPVGETSGSYTVDLGTGTQAGFVTIELKQN